MAAPPWSEVALEPSPLGAVKGIWLPPAEQPLPATILARLHEAERVLALERPPLRQVSCPSTHGPRLRMLSRWCATTFLLGQHRAPALPSPTRSGPRSCFVSRMVTRRRRLRFVYGDGRTTRTLAFAEVRGLAPG